MSVRRKWRPPLALLIGVCCVLLVALPVIGLISARLIDNQFVRETERSLQVQAALFAEAYAIAFETEMPAPTVGRPIGASLKKRRDEPYDALVPKLVSASAPILAPPPGPKAASEALEKPYEAVRPHLTGFATSAKKRTLAGFVATDDRGRIVAASGDNQGSLAHLEEIQAALQGEDVSSLRLRADQEERHPLTSISRNTRYRVFVAAPVVVGDRIIGAVLLSRTPTDLRKFLYQEQGTLLRVALIMLIGAVIIGALFWRLISGPIRKLAAQSRAVAERSRALPEPLDHYGVRELADLGDSVLSMARRLDERSKMVETYTAHVTHELKSPTTSIIGAAELLETASETMPAGRRDKLVRSIHEQGRRMNTLLERLRTLAKTPMPQSAERAVLDEVVARLRQADPGVDIRIEGPAEETLPLEPEQAHIALLQLITNARQHGADRAVLTYDRAGPTLIVEDNGKGIDPQNLERVITPFFTTRRDQGGTGMGLAIAAAVAEASDGRLTAETSDRGARLIFDWSDRAADRHRSASPEASGSRRGSAIGPHCA